MTTPKNTEAERAALACALQSQSAADYVLTHLDDGSFYDPKHREIFRAILDLTGAREPVDATTVSGRLSGSVSADFVQLLEVSVVSPRNVASYCAIVRDVAVRRLLIEAAAALSDSARTSEDPAQKIADEAAASISTAASAHDSAIAYTSKELMIRQYDRLEAIRSGKAKRGLQTGYPDLDDKLGGMMPGNLIIVAGRPSMGKTALATNIAAESTHHGAKALMFSLEMSADEVGERMLAGRSRVELTRLRAGQLGHADYSKIVNAQGAIGALGFSVIDRAGLSVTELRSLARREKAARGLDLILVDYLQLMHGDKGGNREREIASVSLGLKELAKELQVPVIALSQLSRQVEARANKRPMMSDLRESGSLEQDADVVLFVYRDEYYNPDTSDKGIAELLIAKNRNGATANDKDSAIKLKWFGAFTRFDSLARAS